MPKQEAIQGQLRHDDADPRWLDRDRLVCASDAPAHAPGTILPIAAGLAFGAAVGMAIAERLLAARFGRSLVDHRIWLIAGAAELAAGTTHESAAIAGLQGLARLAVVAVVPPSESAYLARFSALGWIVRRVPAEDPEAMSAAVSAAQRAQKPTLVAVLADSAEALPADLFAALAAAPRAAGTRRSWLKRLKRHAAHAAFAQSFNGLPVAPRLAAIPSAAPSPTSQAWLDAAAALMPELAFLPPPSATHAPWLTANPDPVWAPRPQALSAALLGMALHGGMIPIGRVPAAALPATTAAAEAAARLAVQIIHVANSAGTQPASGQGSPKVFDPADDTETIACLHHALQTTSGPTAVIIPPPHTPALTAGSAAISRGAHRIAGDSSSSVTLIANGPLVHVAAAVRTALSGQDLPAALVSVPNCLLFLSQDAAHRESVLGTALRIALTAEPTGPLAALLRPGDLRLPIGETVDAHSLAQRIARHLARSPAILEDSGYLLETSTNMD